MASGGGSDGDGGGMAAVAGVGGGGQHGGSWSWHGMARDGGLWHGMEEWSGTGEWNGRWTMNEQRGDLTQIRWCEVVDVEPSGADMDGLIGDARQRWCRT